MAPGKDLKSSCPSLFYLSFLKVSRQVVQFKSKQLFVLLVPLQIDSISLIIMVLPKTILISFATVQWSTSVIAQRLIDDDTSFYGQSPAVYPSREISPTTIIRPTSDDSNDIQH